MSTKSKVVICLAIGLVLVFVMSAVFAVWDELPKTAEHARVLKFGDYVTNATEADFQRLAIVWNDGFIAGAHALKLSTLNVLTNTEDTNRIESAFMKLEQMRNLNPYLKRYP